MLRTGNFLKQKKKLTTTCANKSSSHGSWRFTACKTEETILQQTGQTVNHSFLISYVFHLILVSLGYCEYMAATLQEFIPRAYCEKTKAQQCPYLSYLYAFITLHINRYLKTLGLEIL